jgi:signal transduction histidine kinase/ketosteroid isomerase-like protein
MDLMALPARYHRAFNEHAFEVWREVFDEDVEFFIDGLSLRGVDAVIAHGLESVSQSPGLHIASERIVAESGDTIVTEISLVAGDPARGGSRRAGTACEICRVRDGRIVSCRSYHMRDPAERLDAVRVPARAEAGVTADEQAALRRVATLVAQGIPQAEVFAAVTEEAGSLVWADTTSLMRFEPDDTVTLVAAWSAQGADLPIGSSHPVRQELRSRREGGLPWRWSPADLPLTEPFVQEALSLGIRTFVGVPIAVDGRVWGFALASSTAVRPFPDDVEARIAGFTDLVATAIANAEARAHLRTLANEQGALRRVAILVAQSLPPSAVFEAVTQEVGLLSGADLARMERYEPDGTVTGVGAWSRVPDKLAVGTRFDIDGLSVARDVRKTGGPVRLDSFDGATGGIAQEARRLGIRSSVGCPIVVAGQLWGVIAASTKRDDPFPANTESQIANFTRLVATAIENAETRGELRRMADEQAGLRRVATLVARGVAPDLVFAVVAEEVGRLFGAENTAVARYEADDAIAMVGSWSSRTSDDLARTLDRRAVLGGQNVTTLVFETGRPARIDRYPAGDSSAITANARAVGSRSAVGAPIRVDGRLWGSLAVASSREAGLPAGAEERLADFAELAATTIANAEAHTKLTQSRARIVATADDTRRRIERDLHDGAQQRLVSLSLELRAAQAAVPPELGAELDHAIAAATGALDELREIARGIHPAILAEGGLGPALRSLARRSAVPVEVNIETTSRYPPPVEVAAYYVVSEALTNTAKHANASHAEATVEEHDSTLLLRVGDDGAGGAQPLRGSGLMGLRDRVEALGGSIDVHSPVGQGTVIQVSLPIEQTDAVQTPGGR